MTRNRVIWCLRWFVRPWWQVLGLSCNLQHYDANEYNYELGIVRQRCARCGRWRNIPG